MILMLFRGQFIRSFGSGQRDTSNHESWHDAFSSLLIIFGFVVMNFTKTGPDSVAKWAFILAISGTWPQTAGLYWGHSFVDKVA
jgi:hypothetical protein